MTGENLGYKPDAVQKAKFEYSALGQVFNKGLNTNERKERLLKRLKNIEGKNEQQLELIKNQGEKQLNVMNKSNLERGSKQLEIESVLNPQAKKLIDEINKEIKDMKTKNFCAHIET